MNLKVVRLGQNLAVRIPAQLVHRLGLKAGDHLQARMMVDGGLCLRHAVWDRKAFSRELDAARENMTPGDSVMDDVRRGARY